MPYQSMSLEDFAKHVSMDMRDVRRLAERDKLPGRKVGGQWRFNRARVTEWLQQEMPSLSESRLIALERSMGEAAGDGKGGARSVVTGLIGIEGIEIALHAKTKTSVLRELVKLAERTGLLYDADGLLNALQERESLCPTALQGGVAIPHPRQPMPYVSAEPLICVARVSRGIGFGSATGELTRLFFLICCHYDRSHLRVLARLMRILDEGTVAALLDAATPEKLLETLIAKEDRVAAEMG